MKNFLSHINILNLALVAAILFSLNHNFWTGPQSAPAPAAKTSRTTGTEKADSLLKTGQDGFTNGSIPDSPDSYSIIASQNLFNPDRKIPVETVVLPPPPKPDLILHGTLIMGDLSVAYIEEQAGPQGGFAGGAAGPWPAGQVVPGTGGQRMYPPSGPGPQYGRFGRTRPFYGPSTYGQPGMQGIGGQAGQPGGQAVHGSGNARIKSYKKGDQIEGFVITSIETDKVLLVRGKESMEIFLSKPVTDLSGMNAPAGRF